MRSVPPLTRRPLVLALALLGSHAAAAQVANNSTASGQLEEVVVTGQYTISERIDTATGLGLTLAETPQSVSVVTAQRIIDQDLRSLTDVVNNAAGISARAQDSSRYSYAARGFAIDNYQIDGIPISWEPGGNAGETQTDTTLFERVEVVRGATGLLTGAGNPSASINLVRKHADSREFTGQTIVSAGRWNSYRAMADVSSPLNGSGSVRGRVVVNLEESDSFRDYAGDEKSVFYGVVEADLGQATLLRVGGSYQDNSPTASTWGGLPIWLGDGSLADWDRSDTTAPRWASWSSTVENYYLDLVHDFGGDWQAKLSVNHNTNASEQLLLYLSGAPDPVTGLGMRASPRKADTEREQLNISAQVNGTYRLFGQRHELTLGAIDSEQDEDNWSHARSNIADPGDFFAWNGNYPQPDWGAKGRDVEMTTEQRGVYAATRLSLADPLKVILGARVADWEQSGSTYGVAVDYGDTGVVVPYAGVLYDLTDSHRVYASYTEIFQPQSRRDRNGDFLDPIIGTSYEIGLKSQFLDGALQTTVAFFDVEQDNLAQADGVVIVPGTDNEQAYYEAEGANSTGYEVEVTGLLAEGWDISASYTDFDAEDADGNAVNTENPHKLFKVFTTYRFPGAWSRLTVSGGVNWQDGNYTDTFNAVTGAPERVEQDDYALVSMMLRYDFTDRLSAQLNVQNALDETYYSQIGFYRQLEFGAPRDYRLSFNYRF
ncbi:TonB-dependent siderophore receptor [Parahaliea mediterranea]|uniref:TonB-dependent siderophore receptor n=1 Tax=Parahaliea mediterranea TaxID=651086 RepID=A0A939DE48_9GAMM|nr:TonB-dependent siderophore receptor [Parahaliea mediterranea]MBN7796595.1 TonB-dependent siderophore receptor [Parahaliea mediterranea]